MRLWPNAPTHHTCLYPLPAGRLHDKSSLVRKEALRLLQGLMLHNPFGPQLPVDRFEATLKDQNAILEKCLPQQAGDGIEQPIEVEGEAAGQQAAEGQQEGAEVKQEPGAEASAEQMEVDADAEEGAAEGEAAADADGEADGEEEPVQVLPTRKRALLRCLGWKRVAVPSTLPCPVPAAVLYALTRGRRLPASQYVPVCLPSCWPAAQDLGFLGTLEELQVCCGRCPLWVWWLASWQLAHCRVGVVAGCLQCCVCVHRWLLLLAAEMVSVPASQALVATLKSAVAFSKSLTDCMEKIGQVRFVGQAAIHCFSLLNGYSVDFCCVHLSSGMCTPKPPTAAIAALQPPTHSPFWPSPASMCAAAGQLHHQRCAGEHRHAADVQAV